MIRKIMMFVGLLILVLTNSYKATTITTDTGEDIGTDVCYNQKLYLNFSDENLKKVYVLDEDNRLLDIIIGDTPELEITFSDQYDFVKLIALENNEVIDTMEINLSNCGYEQIISTYPYNQMKAQVVFAKDSITLNDAKNITYSVNSSKFKDYIDEPIPFENGDVIYFKEGNKSYELSYLTENQPYVREIKSTVVKTIGSTYKSLIKYIILLIFLIIILILIKRKIRKIKKKIKVNKIEKRRRSDLKEK